MINRLKLALLFLIAEALVSVFYGSGPPATAGGTDTDPVAKLRTLTQPLPVGEEKSGSEPEAKLSLDPIASTTPRGVPARGPRSALGTDTDPVAQLRTLTQPKAALPHSGPLPAGEGENTRREEEGGTDSHPSAVAGFTDSEYAAHIDQLKKKLPSKDFTIIVQKPFVVIGDEPADDVREHSVRTVKWAVDKLKQEYFSKDPKEILDIWLFKDAASYERNAQLLFGYKPNTPYGYYSKIHKALVMNISTGGGTLVHEIVHPFIEANFPNCPPWLNEGLGSLYEQSGEVNGRIHGFTNWRLFGLQASIKARQLPSFRKLRGMSVPEFYNFESGSHYAQSRYLLYYLQQRGLLTKFYREFHKHQKTDPTGYQTLRRVLGNVDMKVFQPKWEKYVMGLTQGYEIEVR